MKGRFFEMKRGFKVAGVVALPTYVQHSDYRILAVRRALADPAIPFDLCAALTASLERTCGAIEPSLKREHSSVGLVASPQLCHGPGCLVR